MTEEELRTLVRAAIANHAGDAQRVAHVVPGRAVRLHSSHALFAIAGGDEMDGPCIVEPSVMCNHCGYCKSYGH